MVKNNKVLSVLRLSIATLLDNKVILFPYAIIVFIQLFLLEILYFSPRQPLIIFFGPIIRKLWTDSYLHYPLNFVLLPNLFQNLQFPIYILFTSYLMALSINILVKINSQAKVNFGELCRKTLASYVHIVIAALIAFVVSFLLYKGYEVVLNRAIVMRSETGLFGAIKKTVIYGAPYFNLLLNILGTALVAYILPIVVIDKKNIFKAVMLNFKELRKSFFLTLLVVFVPSMLYVGIVLLRNNTAIQSTAPELGVVIMAIGVFVVAIIDAVVYTAISLYYLLGKETK